MSSIVRAYDVAQEFEEALAVFDELRAAGVRPNIICYNNALAAASHGALAWRARELVDAMRADGLVPDRAIYASLIGALGKAGFQEEAEAALARMRAEGAALCCRWCRRRVRLAWGPRACGADTSDERV